MYIRKIELHNFKGFSGKHEFIYYHMYTEMKKAQSEEYSLIW